MAVFLSHALVLVAATTSAGSGSEVRRDVQNISRTYPVVDEETGAVLGTVTTKGKDALLVGPFGVRAEVDSVDLFTSTDG